MIHQMDIIFHRENLSAQIWYKKCSNVPFYLSFFYYFLLLINLTVFFVRDDFIGLFLKRTYVIVIVKTFLEIERCLWENACDMWDRRLSFREISIKDSEQKAGKISQYYI